MDDSVSFAVKYNARINDQDLFLGCIVHREEYIRQLSIDSSGDFYRITTIFQDYVRSGANTDSLIESIVKKNANIDFRSDKAMFRIRQFVACYRMVNDIVFGKIDSDEKATEMKLLENKITKVPAVFKIYRYYVPEVNNLASLPSSGVALYVHIAYHLSSLNIDKRNEIFRSLL